MKRFRHHFIALVDQDESLDDDAARGIAGQALLDEVEAYAQAVKQADTRTVDGFGLWIFLRLFGQKTFRVTGVDLAEQILSVAAQEKWRVGLIGGEGKETAGIE